MASTFLKPSAITAEALRILHNSCPFISTVDKQHDKQTTFGGQKRGPNLNIRLPNKYTVRRVWAIDTQEVTEQQVTLAIGQVFGVDMIFEESDLALEINEFSRRFIKPAISVIASAIDAYCLGVAYKDVYNSVGTPGTTPNNAQIYLDGAAKLDDYSVPQDDRSALINPTANSKTVGGLLSLFNPQDDIKKKFISGQMGTAPSLGFDFYKTQNIQRHTTGSTVDDASVLVDDSTSGNIAEGMTTIHIDGLDAAAGTLKEGDVFTIGSVYAVNAETKASTGVLQQFVVQADVTAASNECDVTFLPALYSSGALQNVDALPADGAAVTFWGSASTAYPQNMLYHRDAFTFATANLEMPNDVSFKAQMEMDGINMRILRQYQIRDSSHPCRIDVYGGFLVQLPELACRLWG